MVTASQLFADGILVRLREGEQDVVAMPVVDRGEGVSGVGSVSSSAGGDGVAATA